MVILRIFAFIRERSAILDIAHSCFQVGEARGEVTHLAHILRRQCPRTLPK